MSNENILILFGKTFKIFKEISCLQNYFKMLSSEYKNLHIYKILIFIDFF